jgi:hypothetical protein
MTTAVDLDPSANVCQRYGFVLLLCDSHDTHEQDPRVRVAGSTWGAVVVGRESMWWGGGQGVHVVG